MYNYAVCDSKMVIEREWRCGTRGVIIGDLLYLEGISLGHAGIESIFIHTSKQWSSDSGREVIFP